MSFKMGKKGVPVVVQWVKDLVLLQLWHRLQLQPGFDPWPGNFMLQMWQKKKKKKKKKKKRREKKKKNFKKRKIKK